MPGWPTVVCVRPGDVVNLRDAEIPDLRAAIPGDEEVGGLDVAVDEARVVRRLQAARRLRRDPQRVGERDAAPASCARASVPPETYSRIR